MKWYQLHLATAVVISIAAAAFMALNFTRIEGPKFRAIKARKDPAAPRLLVDLYSHRFYGWPFLLRREQVVEESVSADDFRANRLTLYAEYLSERSLREMDPDMDKVGWVPTAVVANIAIGVAGLALVGWVSEKIARRKERV